MNDTSVLIKGKFGAVCNFIHEGDKLSDIINHYIIVSSICVKIMIVTSEENTVTFMKMLR